MGGSLTLLRGAVVAIVAALSAAAPDGALAQDREALLRAPAPAAGVRPARTSRPAPAFDLEEFRRASGVPPVEVPPQPELRPARRPSVGAVIGELLGGITGVGLGVLSGIGLYWAGGDPDSDAPIISGQLVVASVFAALASILALPAGVTLVGNATGGRGTYGSALPFS